MNSAAIAAAVAAASQPILPIGSGTKSALAASSAPTQRLELRELSGIVSYEPTEFLITARSGTPMHVLVAALAEHGQYLPFDPMFVDQGATLGGSLASGLSGANQLLYGRLRDFVMEVELVDGLGKLVRGGGKVVKNAAGFDLPKLVVGSYGRLGIITEVTLKVFPRPAATATLQATLASLPQGIAAIKKLRSLPLPLACLEMEPENSGGVSLWARFAGPADSLAAVLARATLAVPTTSPAMVDTAQEGELWRARAQTLEHTQHAESALVRIATTLECLPELIPRLLDLDGSRSYCSAAGAITWLSLPGSTDLTAVDKLLTGQQLAAVVVTGKVDQLTALGNKDWLAPAQRIQRAMDPEGKFARFQVLVP